MNAKRKTIHSYIQAHKNEIVYDLKELIKIPSVRSEAEESAPFGKACADVLEHTKKLYEREGLKTELNQKRGYLLSYFGKGEKSIGIFSHADVVPVSDGWMLTKPFEPIEKDGFLVGRGALDNKSGVIASLYCAKMLKELNIPFNSRLVCFTGANEESGMQDVQNYLSNHQKPDFSIVPDTAFPLYRGNKGRIAFLMRSTSKLSGGIEISGGTGATVIGEATVTLPFTQSLFDEIIKCCNERISAEHNDKIITVKAKGIAKHSAIPEGSLSAVSLLAGILKECEALSQSEKAIFENIYDMSSCHYGEYFEIACNDTEFGKLTCVLTKITTEKDGTVIADFNIRYGVSTNKNIIIEKIADKASMIGWTISECGGFSIPHSLPADNIFVKRLLEVYNDFTNRENTTSYVNAGGTYRQYLKDAAEIGTTNIWGHPEGLPQGHSGAHQPDECINIEGFLEAIEIAMLMILECDKIMEDRK